MINRRGARRFRSTTSERLEQRNLLTFVSIDRIDGDTGALGDFVTSDQQLLIEGSFTLGSTLNVAVAGTVYDETSPELSTNDDTWTLDLTALDLAFGDYEVLATAFDTSGDPFTDALSFVVDAPCNVDQLYELRDTNGLPISGLATVQIDSTGVPNLDLISEDRMTPTSNVYFVDELAGEGGDGLTWGNAFQDIDEAFTAIKLLPVAAATVYVASGNYTWGDAGNVGFRLNIIGQGIGNTVVTQAGTNVYAAQFRANDLYIEGMSFVGGETAVDVRNAPKVTLIDSEFTDASVNDGVNIVNASTVVVYGSDAHHNASDGFSYTNPSGAPMQVLEAFVNGSDNGLNLEWSSQGSTTHETVDIVRVGGTFERNPTNISDVSSGVSWNVAVTTADALANDQGGQYLNFNVSGNGTAWIIAGDYSQGTNSPAVVNAQPGAVIRYVSAYDTLDPATHIVSGQAVLTASTLTPIVGCSLGDVAKGVAAEDAATGTGYIMHTSESVFTRFADSPPHIANSENMVAVRNENGIWQYSDNLSWFDFAPTPSDRLLASVDFTADTILSLQGATGKIEGIEQGYLEGDLTFAADTWGGRHNNGEFTVAGTFFVPAAPGINGTTFELGPLNSGIAVEDVATGTGFLMFTAESVFTRFATNSPHVKNSDHLIGVRFANGAWEYSNNTSWYAFTPAADDRLLAAVNYSNDTVVSLLGQTGAVEGISQGFAAGDLVFSADVWNSKHNNGEFYVSGTYFLVTAP